MGKTNGYWPTHPDKDLQKVLVIFAANGWTISRGSKYYMLKCPCGLHKTSLHLTPSNPYHGNEKLNFMRRQPCHRGNEDTDG